MARPKKKKENIQSIENPNEALITQVRKWQQSSQSNIARWELNQLKWHKMRMRIKKTKNFPFVGCANFRMPTIETKLRKLKASLVNTIFGIRPVVQVVPTPSGTFDNAMKIEKFLDHLICDVTDTKNKLIIAIDQSLEKGFDVLKPHWCYEETTRIEDLSLDDLSMEEVMAVHSINTTTDQLVEMLVEYLNVDTNDNVRNVNMTELRRVADMVHSGESKVTVKLRDVIKNYPDADLCMDERIYVGTDSGYDPQACQYIIHEFFLPLDTVKKNAEIKGWDVSEVNSMYALRKSDMNQKNIQLTKDYREGITRLQNPDELVKIWECYCWYDINNDGEKEKCVITMAADFSKILRKSTLPFFNAKWPFVKLFYELTDDRWYSHRGLPELIEDLAKEIDIQHMQKIDNQTIRNTPMFLFRSGMINNKTVQFVFGQGLPVNGMTPLEDVLAPVNNSNGQVEFSYEREEQVLSSKIEELIGQIDFTMQSMINKRQPRTLGEVQLQQQNQQVVFSLDAELYKGQIQELFTWYWELWCQYGDDEYEFAYFGKEGWEKIKLNREEVQGKYKIIVRGNDQNTNPQVRLQKAENILVGMENPVLMQSGVVTPQNLANTLKMVYQEMGIDNWQELVTFPNPNPPPPPPPVKINMEDLTPMEQAQVLQKYGIQPDIQGMMLKNQSDIGEKMAETQMKMAEMKMNMEHSQQEHQYKMDELKMKHKHDTTKAMIDMAVAASEPREKAEKSKK